MGNVTYLGDRVDNNELLTVEQTLTLAAAEVLDGAVHATKVAVILLDDRNGVYDLRIRMGGGISCSQTIALLEIAKGEVKELMGY